MHTQPNTPTEDLALINAAKRRLQWKAAFALPMIFAASMLTGCLDYVGIDSERRGDSCGTECEAEIMEPFWERIKAN